MMAHVIEQDGVSTVDYLTGDDNYKRDWMSTRRERRGIAAYNTGTPPGLAAFTSYRLKALLKALRR